MDEDALTQSVRKFLKQLGVTGQREIEKAITTAVQDGQLEDGADVQVTGTIKIESLGLEHQVEATLKTQ